MTTQHEANTAIKKRSGRWKTWLKRGMVCLVLGVIALYGVLSMRSAFPGMKPVDGTVVEATQPEWWAHPAPLTEDEVAGLRWLAHITHQLPTDEDAAYWGFGGKQYGITAIRYQAAFSGYAASLLGMRTPAYIGQSDRILQSLIARMVAKPTWAYIRGYWKDKPWYPDPCAHENIMYSGHVLQLLALHEAMTGDPKYRTEGVTFVWDETTSFHYDTTSLAAVTVAQMRANACGGVACEPGLVFFPCNNHPQIALRLMEGMELGSWKADREKWERWALSSYYAVLGGGAFKLLYHQDTNTFVPRGHPALDGWSLLWYYPWASNPEALARIWAIAKTHFVMPGEHPVGEESSASDELVEPSCCSVQGLISSVAVGSLLAPAARVCGDREAADKLDAWLDENYMRREGEMLYWFPDTTWRIGVTANRLISMAQKNGSDLRALVLRPLPRAYFSGPLIRTVLPEDTAVYQAYREGDVLVVELGTQSDEVVLQLAHVPAIDRVEGVSPEMWHYEDKRLKLKLPKGKTLFRIIPAKDSAG